MTIQAGDFWVAEIPYLLEKSVICHTKTLRKSTKFGNSTSNRNSKL